MTKWVWNIGDHEIWDQCFDEYDTPEAAFKAAKKARGVEHGEPSDAIYIAEVVEHKPVLDAERIIEADQEEAFDECGEVSESYLENISVEMIAELEEQLTDVYSAWLKKYNQMPSFYGLRNSRRWE